MGRKPKNKKAVKPVKKGKLLKAKKIKEVKTSSVPKDQLKNLSKWLSYYEENKKLPHNKIMCSKCKTYFLSMKGIAMSWAMKAFDGDINRILTESLCKDCKSILKPKEPKEPKPKVISVETQEEREARYDEIRKTIPKIDLHRSREVIDLRKDKEACKQHTYFACNNPQVFLDLGCAECSISKYCACPIKDLNRKPDGRAPKIKKFVTKPKTS